MSNIEGIGSPDKLPSGWEGIHVDPEFIDRLRRIEEESSEASSSPDRKETLSDALDGVYDEGQTTDL